MKPFKRRVFKTSKKKKTWLLDFVTKKKKRTCWVNEKEMSKENVKKWNSRWQISVTKNEKKKKL